MLLSAVSVLAVAQSSSEISEGLMNNPVCPRKRHRAVLWTLAKLVIFRTQQRRDLTLHDFIDFMRRTKWKMYQAQKRNEHEGDYLTFIDTESGRVNGTAQRKELYADRSSQWWS